MLAIIARAGTMTAQRLCLMGCITSTVIISSSSTVFPLVIRQVRVVHSITGSLPGVQDSGAVPRWGHSRRLVATVSHGVRLHDTSLPAVRVGSLLAGPGTLTVVVREGTGEATLVGSTTVGTVSHADFLTGLAGAFTGAAFGVILGSLQ